MARGEVALSRQLIADATLDEPGTLSAQNAAVLGEPSVSLRRILIHMIEEYARNRGRADPIREQIGGTTGP
ncbi:DinB family protein [Streptomyces sp. TLI_146]|uniref:DinB family protein n=1 Tax=Streptomyces sp. TLI_146 TaxID=1938858 RepID=UPI00214C8BDC|nr:DinB family protein [Streptomyces sp. TLI_146]